MNNILDCQKLTTFKLEERNQYSYGTRAYLVLEEGVPGSFGHGEYKKICQIELDSEDIGVLKKKYLVSELQYKKASMNKLINDLNNLKREIEIIESEYK